MHNELSMNYKNYYRSLDTRSRTPSHISIVLSILLRFHNFFVFISPACGILCEIWHHHGHRTQASFWRSQTKVNKLYMDYWVSRKNHLIQRINYLFLYSSVMVIFTDVYYNWTSQPVEIALTFSLLYFQSCPIYNADLHYIFTIEMHHNVSLYQIQCRDL